MLHEGASQGTRRAEVHTETSLFTLLMLHMSRIHRWSRVKLTERYVSDHWKQDLSTSIDFNLLLSVCFGRAISGRLPSEKTTDEELTLALAS